MKTFSRLLPLILSLSFLFTSSVIYAQTDSDSTKIWLIETKNGNEYMGKIQKRNSEEIVLETEDLGTISLKVRSVKSIKEIEKTKLVNGSLWVDNALASRYFLNSSAYNLRKGEGYYQNSWIFFNQVNYGFTDNFSMGLGLYPLFLFGGAPTPIWITPKVSIPLAKDKFNLGAGALLGTIIGTDEVYFYGFTYGVATVGSKDRNISIGLGYGFLENEWADNPLITISGMLRVSKRFYLLTENLFGSFGFSLLSAGGRVSWKRISLDFGGFLPLTSDNQTTFVLPWLSISIPFGRAK